MKFLFLVGAEGTGHHMIRAILAGHLARDGFVDKGSWYRPLRRSWDHARRRKRERKAPGSLDAANLRAELARSFEAHRAAGATHLFESTSFPHLQPRDPLRRPDLLAFAELTEGLIETRYLVLYRDPVSATASLVRRLEMRGDHIHQACIVECNLVHIASQLRQLPTARWRTLRFEEFLAEPTRLAPRLAEWWDLDGDLLGADLANLRPPQTRADIPSRERVQLEAFFDERRLAQWRDFYASNPL